MPRSIPDRWIPYKACGKVIEGTRFICFKFSLLQTVQKGFDEIWDISTLLETIPNLSAVIDLTNTNRYYNPSEFRKAGVLHKKIYMPGRIIPPEEIVQEFMDTVDEFLGKDCESLIGVHCTHGLNRTGYMVCRYMRDKLGVNAKDAIHKFEIARGYKIERDNYIAHLMGNKPPPPDLGVSTNISAVLPSDHNNDQNSSSSKINRNAKSWRDEYLGDKEDGYETGRYVRNPNYRSSNKRRERSRSRTRSNRENYSRSNRNYRTDRDCPDSDRSYDYRHDY
ncbi:unnamed protein product [Diatraea saccharalis]|uniref:Tyrosine specific protein phosphatases domain-containing protein n=1 Tax=Diatraea saccharalis TaxID=40085 RepID=A0A9N9R188_9NEOP|nr:unnamed protein product [Diatraea saccharalis]